jgi:hypothetical protein
MSLIPVILSMQNVNRVTPLPVLSDIGLAIVGQSNAGNRENVVNLSAGYAYLKASYTNINYKDNNQYPTRTLYNRTSGVYGVDLGINAILGGEYDSIEQVKWFQGSQAISYFLPNNAGWTGIKSVIADLEAQGRTLNVFVWVQGEQDAIINNTNYLTNIQSLRSNIETECGNTDLLFVYNQLHVDYYDNTYPIGTANVRAAQESFQSAKNIMINIDDITDWALDTVHFKPDTLAELGVRMGTSILNNL